MSNDKMRAAFDASGYANKSPHFLPVWNAAWQAALAAQAQEAPSEPAGEVVANHPVHGWHVRPFVSWESIGAGTKLYTHPAPASAQAAVPDGWKLVPVEPTEEMKYAAEKAEARHRCDDRKRGGRDPNLSFAAAYRAMLNAAPSTQQGGGE